MSYGTPDFDGYDPSSVLADRAEAEPLTADWQAALDASIEQAKALREASRHD